MTDWSGGHYDGRHPVEGPGPVDPEAPTGIAPQRPHPAEPAAGRWEPHPQGAPGGWGPQQPRPGRWEPQQPPPAGWQPPRQPAGPWTPQPPPPPQWQPGPGAGSPPPFGAPPQWQPAPRKSRKPLIVTLAAGGAVIVVVAVVLVITLAGGSGGGGGGSAGDVVKGYLEALARGDAETALSYSNDQPATKEFLTDDILKKQIAQWPITNIRILNDDSTSASAGSLGSAQVHVVANFGDKSSDATMDLKSDHGRWRLDAAAIKVEPDPGAEATDAAAKTLTFFGKPIAESTVYVFPGWIDLGTTNPYMTVTAKPLLLDQLTLMGVPWVLPSFVLSGQGRDAVNGQLAAAMANCTKSNLLAPPNCPVHLDPYGLAEGTVAWGTADLSAVKVDGFDPYGLTLTFYGQVSVPVTVKTTDGGTNQGPATDFLSGTADMAKTPPDLKFQ